MIPVANLHVSSCFFYRPVNVWLAHQCRKLMLQGVKSLRRIARRLDKAFVSRTRVTVLSGGSIKSNAYHPIDICKATQGLKTISPRRKRGGGSEKGVSNNQASLRKANLNLDTERIIHKHFFEKLLLSTLLFHSASNMCSWHS